MIITRTPLRVSFLGGGSDFPAHFNAHGGACLSSTINKYIFVSANRRNDHKVKVSYSDLELTNDAAELKHDLIKHCLLSHNITNGIEVSTIADITGRGSGLGSSSSVTVGMLNALERGGAPPSFLSIESNRIEIDMLSRPQGTQDSLAAAYGGMNLFLMSRGRTEVKKVSLLNSFNLFDRLMLFNTGTTRESKHILKEQHQKTAENVTHLYRLTDLAHRGYESIVSGRYDEFGHLLNVGWQVKKNLSSQITTPEIDIMYDKAMRSGAIGGKICGAGAGGFLLLYVPNDKQTAVKSALNDYEQLIINYEPEGSKVIYNDN